MRKVRSFMAITEIDMKNNEPEYAETPVFEHDGKLYVRYEDFSELVSLNAFLAFNAHEEALKKYAEGKAIEYAKQICDLNDLLGVCECSMYKQKKNIRKRGKLIARLQKKLHYCYKTIDLLCRLCALLLQYNDNLNLCMVKTEIPTEILLKIYRYGRSE